VLSLYDACPRSVLAVVRAFITERHEMLVELYRTYRNDLRPGEVAGAPEALMIYERLEHDRDRLTDLWCRHAVLADLEQLATFYGVAL
jgi:hypothetical protein